MAKADLSADEARTFISYDQATGAFHWAADLGARAKAGSRAGSKERQGYIAITIRGETYKAHRLAWLLADGGWPNGEVDHINGDRADNRLCNLRVTTRATNIQNQRAAHAGKNSTGLLGVSHRPFGKFIARIQVNKQSIGLGYFNTAEAAHAAYLEAKRRLHVTCTV